MQIDSQAFQANTNYLGLNISNNVSLVFSFNKFIVCVSVRDRISLDA